MGGFQPEGLRQHGFISATATSEQRSLTFRVTTCIEDFINYGPGELIVGFDKEIPEEIPESSTEFIKFKIDEGLPPKFNRACDTLFFKCLTENQTAEFKGVGW